MCAVVLVHALRYERPDTMQKNKKKMMANVC